MIRLLIRLYQLTLSSVLGRQCRYLPTCSAYMDEAIARFGLWAGMWMGLARVCRCHPLGRAGFDPPPERLPDGASPLKPWRYGIWMCLILYANVAEAETGRIAGDSIGVGIAWAAKLPSTAKNSISIHSGAVMDQLRHVQKGETLFLSLGANDAVVGVLEVRAKVAHILAETKARGARLVWIGPPCVLKPWETYAQKLDKLLAAQLAATKIVYVSLQTQEFCSQRLHAREGVHFTFAGYERAWYKAAAAAAFPVTQPVRHHRKHRPRVGGHRS